MFLFGAETTTYLRHVFLALKNRCRGPLNTKETIPSGRYNSIAVPSGSISVDNNMIVSLLLFIVWP